MRGGLVGSICFLAFLISSDVKGQSISNPYDLEGSQNEVKKANAVSSAEKDTVTSLSNADLSEAESKNDGQDTLQNDIEQRSSSAIAVANAGGGNKGNLGIRTSAQASANALANTGSHGHGYGLPSSALSHAYANANTQTTSGDIFPYGFKGWKSADGQTATEKLNLNNQAVDSIEDLANSAARAKFDTDEEIDLEGNSRIGGGFSNAVTSAQAFSGAVSRAVPQNEYVIPQSIPGGQDVITCSHEHEMHNVWSPVYQCLVCVCIREGWAFKTICVSCNTCISPPPQNPIVIMPQSPPSIPSSLPESQESCAPLPKNMPFENPLNPCQTCVCKSIINVYGREDVQIQCEDNPQCVTPPEYIPIHPLPLPTRSVPMPLCQSLPLNVKFPHPTESCMLCTCIMETTSVLVQERRMICQPDPECIIPYSSTPEPTTIPSLPISGLKKPSSGDVYAIPWPPVVPSLSRPPSPLPGTPPHDTCRPYPPNQPFQHPWDECQICICSEIFARNLINIEVNCYTKKSCCVEPPLLPDPQPLPYKPVPLIGQQATPMYGNLIFIEPKCRYQAPNQPFIVDCNVCVCETMYRYVYARCTPQPNCGVYPSRSSSSAEATAAATAQSNTLAQLRGYPSNYNLMSSKPSHPLVFPALPLPGRSSSSSAESVSNAFDRSPNTQNQASSFALTEALANSGNQYPHNTAHPSSASYSSAEAQSGSTFPYGNYPLIEGQFRGQTEVEAPLNAQTSAISPYGSYPYSPASNDQSNAVAQLESSSELNSLSSYGPNIYGPGARSSAQTQAEALAYVQSGNIYPYSVYPYSSGEGQSSVQTDAISSAQSHGAPPYGTYPYYSGGDQYSAQAQAETIANAQSLSPAPYGGYPYFRKGSQGSATAQSEGLASSQLYPSLYPNPTINIGPLYQPGVDDWHSIARRQGEPSAPELTLSKASSANSQLQTLHHGVPTAQSLAQASAMLGRPLIKSGKGLCKYAGHKYHHHRQACYCFAELNGQIYTLCLGNPCT